MRFLRALLALVASTLFVLVLAEVNRYMHSPSDYFEVELNVRFFAGWLFCDLVPILCWLVVLLPLLSFTRFLDRWPWYWSSLCGFVIGAGATAAILFAGIFKIKGTQWKLIFMTVWALAVAIQFIVVSLTKRWAKAAVPTPVKTESGGQS